MEGSPTNSRKRQAKQSVQALEDDIMNHGPGSNKLKASKKDHNDDHEPFFDSMRDIENLLGPQLCGICDRDISKSIKVKCLDCMNPPLSTCLECLRTGRVRPEISEHRKSHAYFIYDNLGFPLFTKDWTAKEELLLIQGIMKCGLGNWADIADQYVKTKQPKECEDHYFAFYNKSKDDPIPQNDDFIVKGKKTIKNGTLDLLIDDDKHLRNLRRLKEYQEKRQAEIEAEQKEFAPLQQMQNNDQSVNNTARQGKIYRRENTGLPDLYSIVGYMPKRGDFEQEYDGDADTLLADLEFFDDDTEQDIALKNDVIELYNARLDERIRRKKFVIDRGLLDFKKIQKQERKKTKEEREIINSMKIFARFNSPEDHEKLVNSLLKERLLREVIEQLKFFKSKGLTSLDQIEKYIDTQKKKQTQCSSYGVQERQKQYSETEEFLKNPRDFISMKSANLLEQSSLDKRNSDQRDMIRNSMMMTEPKWQDLDKQEKWFCTENQIRPEDYLTVKKHIIQEQGKNKAITEALVREKGKELKNFRDKVPVIYDFWVKSGLVNNK